MRGTWEDLKSDMSQIAKFQMAESESRLSDPAQSSSVRFKAQVRSRKDAVEDLARKTGDFGLYGKDFSGNILVRRD